MDQITMDMTTTMVSIFGELMIIFPFDMKLKDN